jgi:hypothetical protein
MRICNQVKNCQLKSCYHHEPHDPITDAVMARLTGNKDWNWRLIQCCTEFNCSNLKNPDLIAICSEDQKD